jgi:hypothetical protein
MDDTLYTISDKRIRANSLVDMGDIKLIGLDTTGGIPIPIGV